MKLMPNGLGLTWSNLNGLMQNNHVRTPGVRQMLLDFASVTLHKPSMISTCFVLRLTITTPVFITTYKKMYCCDKCSKNVYHSGESYPHDGCWLESKRGLSSCTFHDRWLAGENFMWYCTQCHAVRLGYGTGDQADEFARLELGMEFHAMLRHKRCTGLRTRRSTRGKHKSSQR